MNFTDFSSSSDLDEDNKQVRRTFERINFNTHNFRETFRITPAMADSILNTIGQQLLHKF